MGLWRILVGFFVCLACLKIVGNDDKPQLFIKQTHTATKSNQFQEPIWGSHSNAKQQVSTVFDGHNLERVPIFWIDSLDGHLYPYLLLVKSPFLDVNLEAVEMFTYWLVVWNIWIIFPYIGIIIPTDFHIFQRGRYTTNQPINDA